MSTWYVRPSGGSYGVADGISYDTAWDGFSNITWGTGGVVAGDTLYVCGIFTELLTVGASGASGNTITIRGDYYDDPGIIDAESTRDHCILLSEHDYLNLIKLTIHSAISYGLNGIWSGGCTISDCDLSDCAGALMFFRREDGLIINGNTFHDTNNIGLVVDGTTSINIYNNIFSNITEYCIDINLNGNSPTGTVNNNIITGFGSDGVAIHSVTPAVNSLFVENNRIYGGTNSGEDGIDLYNSSNIVVRNNIIYSNANTTAIKAGGPSSTANKILGNCVYNNSQIGIRNNGAIGNYYINNTMVGNDCNLYIAGSSSSAIVENNISIDASQGTYAYDVRVPINTSGSTLDYNCWYRSDNATMLTDGTNIYTVNELTSYREDMGYGTNSFFANPLLNKSYRLKKGSPCIDAGVIISGITDGYKGDAPDIGWKEYVKMVGGLSLGLSLQL